MPPLAVIALLAAFGSAVALVTVAIVGWLAVPAWQAAVMALLAVGYGATYGLKGLSRFEHWSVVRRSSGDAEALYRIGHSIVYSQDWYWQGDDVRAIEAFKRAVALQPGFARAWRGLGDAWMIGPDPVPERAVAAIEQALALEEHVNAWRGLDLALMALDDPARSIDEWDRILQLYPNSATAREGLAAAQARRPDSLVSTNPPF